MTSDTILPAVNLFLEPRELDLRSDIPAMSSSGGYLDIEMEEEPWSDGGQTEESHSKMSGQHCRCPTLETKRTKSKSGTGSRCSQLNQWHGTVATAFD
jgi:hypothetical protein